jgi:hypothetical protein
MGREPSIRTVARTAVVTTWLVVLAVAGRPAWAGVLLGVVLVLVWAAPYLLVTNRRPRKSPAVAGPARDQGTTS